MNKKEKLKQIELMIERTLDGTSIELLWVDYKKSGQDWVLQVFVDEPGGVTFETCSTVSHRLLDALENEDPLSGEYLLEVSSAGVDRPLRKPEDFQRFCGERIYAKLHRAVEGQKVFTGTLLACHDDTIEVENEVDRKVYQLPLSDMAKATLKPILNFN